MKGIIVLAVTVFALAAAEEGRVGKRGNSGQYAYAAPVAKAAVAVAPAPAVYASPLAFGYNGGQIGYAAPGIQYAGLGYAAPGIQYAGYGGHALGYAGQAIGYGAAAAPVGIVPAGKSTGPQGYSQQVPAAAIRNVETVGVTKTITPVVTKTTTYNTHSEPALSVGHVQGYTQHAQGEGKIAGVRYNTQFTQFLTPSIGVNGPVTYTGPAVGNAGVAVAAVPAYGAQAIGYAGGLAGGHGYGGFAGGQGLIGAYAQPALYAQPAYQPALYAQPAYYAQPQVATQTQTYAAPSVTYGSPAPAKGGY